MQLNFNEVPAQFIRKEVESAKTPIWKRCEGFRQSAWHMHLIKLVIDIYVYAQFRLHYLQRGIIINIIIIITYHKI